MDGLDLLKRDHDDIRELFERLAEASSPRERRRLADRIVLAVEQHALLEERAFYPELRRYADAELAEDVLVSLEEHLVARRLCADLRAMDEDDERFLAKLKVLRGEVEQHLDEEEAILFPVVRQTIGPADLRMIGETLRQARLAIDGRRSAPPDRPSVH